MGGGDRGIGWAGNREGGPIRGAAGKGVRRILRHLAVATLDRGRAPDLVVVRPQGRLPDVGGLAPPEARCALDVHPGVCERRAAAGDYTTDTAMMPTIARTCTRGEPGGGDGAVRSRSCGTKLLGSARNYSCGRYRAAARCVPKRNRRPRL